MLGKIFRLKIILWRDNKMTITKYRVYWIILLMLFFYNNKRYDIDDHYEMPYNIGITSDEMYR